MSVSHQLLEGRLIHTTLEVSREGESIFFFLPPLVTYIYNKRLIKVGVMEWGSRAKGRS